MSQNDYILVLCLGGGVLSMALGWGMLYVRPNHFYGVRTPATYADRRVWRDANRQSGKGLIALGGAVSLFSSLLLAVPGAPWPLAVFALLAGTAVWAGASVWYASQRLAYYRRIDRGMAAEELQRER
ncbi:MAG: SdpI family protein [Dehalococcoidia bacterium]|nr:SdpI family protein [Dehalococcoidia bacterium]